MVEKGFVDALIKTVNSFDCSKAYRPSDGRTMGMPDVLGYIRPETPREGLIPLVAIEAKQIRPLMDDPYHKGRRTGRMLKHPFSGPQISALRELKGAGVDAFGLVRASRDTAFRIEPEDIPAKTGNFTHEEMIELGKPVLRRDGLWVFWEVRCGEILDSGH